MKTTHKSFLDEITYKDIFKGWLLGLVGIIIFFIILGAVILIALKIIL